MSVLAEDEKKKEKEENIKLEMFDPQKSQKLKAAKEEGKESLHSQMAQKVGPKDCIIVVGTTGLGKSTCVNIYTGQVLLMITTGQGGRSGASGSFKNRNAICWKTVLSQFTEH